MGHDRPWKRLERRVAKKLGGQRVKRMGDYSQIDTDVAMRDDPHLKIDCKLRARHRHHALFEEIRAKYCTDELDRPVLVTREAGKRDILVTITLDHFEWLYRLAKLSLNIQGKNATMPAAERDQA